jgi:hypothetical protein
MYQAKKLSLSLQSIPEMNSKKQSTQCGLYQLTHSQRASPEVTLIFKGDYNIEKNLPQETADLDVFGLGDACQGCRANSYALAGYMEAYHATNGFENAMKKWREVDCFFSVTGHGLGGMHSVSYLVSVI